jgi:NAD(P)-dependent dehydrogenase (short-subunit alcohol dehydrogenase family)
MIRMAWGRIIHFSSFAGVDGSPGIYAYAATKSAIQGMSRVLAKEYGRLGITSNVVQLGYFDSGLIETLSETRKAEILRNIPSRKFGETVNILNAFRFIIDSEYLNGASISLDGGL